jgi:hypothetical protein
MPRSESTNRTLRCVKLFHCTGISMFIIIIVIIIIIIVIIIIIMIMIIIILMIVIRKLTIKYNNLI